MNLSKMKGGLVITYFGLKTTKRTENLRFKRTCGWLFLLTKFAFWMKIAFRLSNITN